MDQGQGRAAVGAATAMFLVGTLAAVSAVIKDYPLYGGQALRYALAAAVLIVIIARRRLPTVILTLPQWGCVVSLSALGTVVYNIMLLQSTRSASPAMTGMVLGAVPVALAIAGPLMPTTNPVTGATERGRPPSRRVVCAALIVASGTGLEAGLGGGNLRGLMFALGALVCEVAFTLLAVPVLPVLGPVRLAAYVSTTAVPMFLGVGLIMDGPRVLRMPSPGEAGALGYLAVVVTAFAFMLWYAVLPPLGADRAGLFAGVVPVGAIVTTALLGLGQPSLVDVSGCLLVVFGILVGIGAGKPLSQVYVSTGRHALRVPANHEPRHRAGRYAQLWRTPSSLEVRAGGRRNGQERVGLGGLHRIGARVVPLQRGPAAAAQRGHVVAQRGPGAAAQRGPGAAPQRGPAVPAQRAHGSAVPHAHPPGRAAVTGRPSTSGSPVRTGARPTQAVRRTTSSGVSAVYRNTDVEPGQRGYRRAR